MRISVNSRGRAGISMGPVGWLIVGPFILMFYASYLSIAFMVWITVWTVRAIAWAVLVLVWAVRLVARAIAESRQARPPAFRAPRPPAPALPGGRQARVKLAPPVGMKRR